VAEARRPDLRAAAEGVRSAEAVARLARRERIPTVNLGALLQDDGVSDTPAVGLRLSVPVPLWNRGGAAVSQREAEVRESVYEGEAVRQRVEVDVATAYRDY